MATTSAPPKLDPKDVLGLDHLLGDEEIMLRDSVRRWVAETAVVPWNGAMSPGRWQPTQRPSMIGLTSA